MHRRAFLSAVLALALVTVGCSSDDQLTSTWLGSGEALPETVEIHVFSRFEAELETLVDAYSLEHPEVTFEVEARQGTDLLDDLLDGPAPDIYIDVRTRTRQAEDDERVVRPPIPLGSDQLVLIVPAGNPAQVTSLEDFAAESALRLGRCEDDSMCGNAARDALDAADVDPTNMVLLPSQGRLFGAVTDGELDGALVLQTSLAGRDTASYSSVLLPGVVDQRTDIDAVQFGTKLAAQDFMRWLQTSAEAEQILTEAGYRTAFFGRF
ncbi:MAG: substrate-binding domain-containing protein [Acidimicrobiia bacterium]|nr:substrate-binding domain-containing protein [Acidimicrobiia bacterium]